MPKATQLEGGKAGLPARSLSSGAPPLASELKNSLKGPLVHRRLTDRCRLFTALCPVLSPGSREPPATLQGVTCTDFTDEDSRPTEGKSLCQGRPGHTDRDMIDSV